MNLLIRFALTLLGAARRGKLGLFDTSSVAMRVWPNDLDVQMHMNNGRYLSVMDLGRIDLLVRSGFFQEARRRGWFPLVAATAVEYCRPLKLFERYDLHTRLLGWDERWFFLEQQFTRGGKPVAVGTVMAAIRGRAGAVPTTEAVGSIGAAPDSPALPDCCTGLARSRTVSRAGPA